MKYAKFSDVFLSYFRLDDNGDTLVLTDKQGYTRAVRLLPYETRSQGDLISREALKEAIKGADFDFGNYYDDTETIIERVCEIIDNAPPVEPICPYLSDQEVKQPCIDSPCERPQGEWIDICTLPYIRKCSICGVEQGGVTTIYDNFCPNCGADMRGGSKNE